MKNILFFALFCFVLTSCGPAVNTQILVKKTPLNYEEQITVFETYEEVTEPATLIAHAFVGDSGFSVNCKYDVVLAKAMDEARKAGGNAIKITEHKTPDILSSCHRIKYDILYIEK